MFKKMIQFLLIALLVILSGCDDFPSPTEPLTSFDKETDIRVLAGLIQRHYAFIRAKEEWHKDKWPKGADTFEKLTNHYIELAKATETNADYALVARRFVSEFRDAHMSMQIFLSGLPGRVSISFLGFSGERIHLNGKDYLIVTDILPTNLVAGATYPIKVGDIITHVDGEPISEYVKRELFWTRDLGQPESNMTRHMSSFGTMVNLIHGTPKKRGVELTVAKEDWDGTVSPNLELGDYDRRRANLEPAIKKVQLPWVTKDLVDFKLDVRNASQELAGVELEVSLGKRVRLDLLGEDGKPLLLSDIVGLANRESELKEKGFQARTDGFSLPRTFTRWKTSAVSEEAPQNAFARLRAERWVPAGITPVPVKENPFAVMAPTEDVVFPAYTVNVKTKAGKSKKVGYLRIHTFSPQSPAEIAVSQVKDALEHMEQDGITDLVIDNMSNPGGSLHLVMQIAQLFSNKQLDFQYMAAALGPAWVDDFDRSKNNPNLSDPEREFARRYHEAFEKKRATINQLDPRPEHVSDPFPMAELFPYGKVQPNQTLSKPFRIILLVDEMNASCGDIFPYLLKDNRGNHFEVVIVGQRTMGAGGNVVNHFQTPFGGFDLRTTESQLLRRVYNPKSGKFEFKFVENVGVTPDEHMTVSAYRHKKYKEILERAFEIAADVRTFNGIKKRKPLAEEAEVARWMSTAQVEQIQNKCLLSKLLAD